jgi:hypothetical protein
MRFRLLRRRLTVSAPRMAVRSALPWPLRWLSVALVLGFSAAIALWAFEQGKSLAGVDDRAKVELESLRRESAQMRVDLEKAQSVVNTSQSQLIAEQTSQRELVEQIRRLQEENQGLRDDLSFFERLVPSGGGTTAARIRSIQAEILTNTQVKWQVLVIQAAKNPAPFEGSIEVSFLGTLDGAPFALSPPGSPRAVKLVQYMRLGGEFEIPEKVRPKSLTVKLTQNGALKSVQTFSF